MIHVRFINDKEPVMGELAAPDIDGRVLTVSLSRSSWSCGVMRCV